MRRKINRYIHILDFAIASQMRRKFKNISIITIYSILIFLTASLIFFTESLKSEAHRLAAVSPDIILQKMKAGRHDLIPVEYIRKIEEIRGVDNAEKRLWGYYFDPVFGANYTIIVQSEKNRLLEDGYAVLGDAAAATQRIKKGDAITFQSADKIPMLFTVAKIYPDYSDIIAADAVMITETDFRQLFNFPPDYATDIAIYTPNKKETANVASKIATIFPETRVIMRDDIVRSYDAIFSWRSAIATLLIIISIFSFSIFVFDKATGLSGEEKREIAILKAVGWDTSDVLLMKFWEGATISLISFLVGFIAAYIHVYKFYAPIFAKLLKGWSVMQPKLALLPEIDIFQIAVLFSITVVPYITATIIPSWLASITSSDSALRG